MALTRDADEVMLRVRDTGRGIPASFLPHVFERFRQADSSAARPHGGLGLGLAIVRHLVELHGGHVCADNAPDGGALFTIALPRSRRAAAPREVTAPTAPAIDRRPTRLDGIRVLLVEDEPDARDALSAAARSASAPRSRPWAPPPPRSRRCNGGCPTCSCRTSACRARTATR